MLLSSVGNGPDWSVSELIQTSPFKITVFKSEKQFSFFKITPQAFLAESLLSHRLGSPPFPAHESYLIACPGQAGADADHALIVGQVVGDGAEDVWHK